MRADGHPVSTSTVQRALRQRGPPAHRARPGRPLRLLRGGSTVPVTVPVVAAVGSFADETLSPTGSSTAPAAAEARPTARPAPRRPPTLHRGRCALVIAQFTGIRATTTWPSSGVRSRSPTG
jgi:hypothetical protein